MAVCQRTRLGGTLGRHFGVKGRFAGRHGSDAAEVLLHHEQRALAVLDRVFGFGKLSGSRKRHCSDRERQSQGCEIFHGLYLE